MSKQKEQDPVTVWVYSDDLAGIKGRSNINDGDFWGRWWPVVIDGKAIAEMMVDYGDGWKFSMRALPGHTLDVVDDPSFIDPDEHDGPWWAND